MVEFYFKVILINVNEIKIKIFCTRNSKIKYVKIYGKNPWTFVG